MNNEHPFINEKTKPSILKKGIVWSGWFKLNSKEGKSIMKYASHKRTRDTNKQEYVQGLSHGAYIKEELLSLEKKILKYYPPKQLNMTQNDKEGGLHWTLKQDVIKYFSNLESHCFSFEILPEEPIRFYAKIGDAHININNKIRPDLIVNVFFDYKLVIRYLVGCVATGFNTSKYHSTFFYSLPKTKTNLYNNKENT